MSGYKAMIAGCISTHLTAEEKAFFRAEKPWGFILFARNIESPEQLKALVEEMREVVGNPNVPVLIDQEGGRVQRMKQPHWPKYPAGAVLGAIYEQDSAKGLRAAWLQSRIMGDDLHQLGINVDCLPLLDVPIKGAHSVIGDRAYSFDPEVVAAMGRAACEGLLAAGVLPVIKHIPGHGRAFSDSHLELPIVDTDHETLSATDFLPFKKLNDMPLAMTAHVVYSSLDKNDPATTSPRMIGDIIRGELGYDGCIMSDDLSMKALSGDFASKTQSVFAAGCDLVLHCNGDMEEMKAIAGVCDELTGKSLQRAERATGMLTAPDSDDIEQLRNEFAELNSMVA